jgi:hypothetical protein
LRVCPTTVGLTAREISGGSSQPIADVQRALSSLISSGQVTSTNEPEPNYRRYNSASPVTEQPAQPSEPYLNADDKWAAEQRARVLSEETAKRPAEPRRFVPSEEAITAELEKRKQVAPLTPEERRELALTEGRTPRSPQSRIVR